MNRVMRLLVSASLLCSVVSVGRLALPDGAYACSCAPPRSLAEWRDEPNVAILTGTIAAAAALDPRLNVQDGILAVERVFKGPIVAAQMQIQGGDGAMCGVVLVPGARVAMVANVDADVLHPNSCLPFVTLPSPEGDALLADAEATYGRGVTPSGAPADPGDPPPAPTGMTEVGLALVLGGSLAAVVLLFGGIAVLARRRPT